MDDDRRIYALFIGMATARISWYRCVLPALYNGCDWVGLGGEPPNLQFATGYVKGRGEQYDTTMPRYEDYDVVVIQQPRGRGWFRQIQELQSRGIKVLYEADDYAHGIRKAKDHDFQGEFTREDLRSMELCMRAADGMICSTEYLARRYRAYNKRVWVCENGLDLGRYRLSRPERPYLLPSGVVEVPLYGGAERGADGRFANGTKRVGETFVDQADLAIVGDHRWLRHPHGYAYRNVGEDRQNVYLHRQILAEPDGLEIDHLNGDRRDNRRCNLEAVSSTENKARRMWRPGEDPDRGVRLNVRDKWTARVETPHGTVWLGHAHASKEEARAAVAAYRAEHLPTIPAPGRLEKTCTLMWSGATGHQRGIAPWLEMIDRVMTRHPHVRFASIGYPFAQHFQKKYGNRALAVPFAALETYPAAMTIGDIALAPAGDSSFYRAKSALRAMEAGALGIPIVADPTLYGGVVKDGETGFLVETPAAAGSAVEALVQDSSLRLRLGDAARAHVTSTCDMRVRCFAWRKALAEAVGWI